MDPITVPGGKPVTEVPGLSARLPVTIVPPVLVTLEPPRIATFSAAPSQMVCENARRLVASKPQTTSKAMLHPAVQGARRLTVRITRSEAHAEAGVDAM